ncbi:MAG: pimeloyl-ACP methyl ester esterase BioH [Gammaproteobacteria bacterium]
MSHIHIETYGTGRPVVLVHGWAMHTGIWRGFARLLAKRYRVLCVDLPGHGRSGKTDNFSLSVICEQLARQLPDQPCHWLGWSLGGTVVLEMARSYPDRVASVILLASNPRFIKDQAWPGMKETVMDDFADNLAADCRSTLLRFLSLQIKGLPDFKAISKRLRQAVQECNPPDTDTLSGGLAVLKQADLRPALAAIDMPVAAVLGGRDTLVPVEVGAAMQTLNPALHLDIIDQSGHVPFLSHEQRVLDAIADFLEQQ